MTATVLLRAEPNTEGARVNIAMVASLPTYEDFFRAVLRKLNIVPVSTDAALGALSAVSIIEGRNAYWNPLNITHPVGSGGTWNDAGVQMYKTFDEGVAATATFLTGTRWKWVAMALAYSEVRPLILRQFEVEYNSWGSHPTFYTLTTERINGRLATEMTPFPGVS